MSTRLSSRVGVFATVLTSACSGRTALSVVVNTDYDVPDEIDTITVEVTGPSGMLRESTQHMGDDGDPAFPLALWVVPSTSSLGPVTVSAVGFRGEVEVARQTAVVTLVEGASKRSCCSSRGPATA